jgi:O-antigen ligase
MTGGGFAVPELLRRLGSSDWLAAPLAVALYLQFPTLLERRFRGAPEDALMAGALVAATVLRWWSGRLATLAPRRLLLASLPWMLAGLVSGLDALARGPWGVEVVRMWGWAAMGALLASLLDNRRALLRTTYAVVGAGAVVAALNCHQFLTQSWDANYFGLVGARYQNLYGKVDGYRAYGPAGDPNYHAQFLLPLLALALERTWNASGRRRLAAGAVSMVLAPALALTFSRGAMAAIVALAPAALVAMWRWRVRPLGLALTLAAAVGAVAIAGPELLARAATFGDATGEPELFDDAAMRGRLSENLSALHMFIDHPWNGVGLGGYPQLYHQYASRLGLDQRPRRRAHNLYLEVAAETGVPGVLGLLSLLVALFWIVERTRRALFRRGDVADSRRAAGVIMMLASYFATAVFLHLTFRSILWVLIAIGFTTPVLLGSGAANDARPCGPREALAPPADAPAKT